jgi:hypothetical protein
MGASSFSLTSSSVVSRRKMHIYLLSLWNGLPLLSPLTRNDTRDFLIMESKISQEISHTSRSPHRCRWSLSPELLIKPFSLNISMVFSYSDCVLPMLECMSFVVKTNSKRSCFQNLALTAQIFCWLHTLKILSGSTPFSSTERDQGTSKHHPDHSLYFFTKRGGRS